MIWRATQLSDRAHVAYRAAQSWTLERKPATGGPRIVTYRVHSLDPI